MITDTHGRLYKRSCIGRNIELSSARISRPFECVTAFFCREQTRSKSVTFPRVGFIHVHVYTYRKCARIRQRKYHSHTRPAHIGPRPRSVVYVIIVFYLARRAGSGYVNFALNLSASKPTATDHLCTVEVHDKSSLMPQIVGYQRNREVKHILLRYRISRVVTIFIAHGWMGSSPTMRGGVRFSMRRKHVLRRQSKLFQKYTYESLAKI